MCIAGLQGSLLLRHTQEKTGGRAATCVGAFSKGEGPRRAGSISSLLAAEVKLSFRPLSTSPPDFASAPAGDGTQADDPACQHVNSRLLRAVHSLKPLMRTRKISFAHTAQASLPPDVCQRVL